MSNASCPATASAFRSRSSGLHTQTVLAWKPRFGPEGVALGGQKQADTGHAERLNHRIAVLVFALQWTAACRSVLLGTCSISEANKHGNCWQIVYLRAMEYRNSLEGSLWNIPFSMWSA